MKRLLCIVGGMNAGGAETFLMKLYRNIDREKYQMDFCVSKMEKGFYDDEIIKMGGKIIYTTAKSKNPFQSFISLYRIVKQNDYNYVMRISQHSLSALELLAAQIAGAKVRVFRSSNSNTMRGGISAILHKIFMFLPKKVANVKIAPSTPAGEFMFGKKAIEKKEVLFLKNGIPLENFMFDKSKRIDIRKALGISEQLVLGHIGRFSNQKNHEQLLDIFEKVLKQSPDSHLILIGEGELENQIFEKVKRLKIEEKVHFLGVRKDVADILSAIDVFVFPSIYEGMPNVIVEAQANGVPCVISNNITPEVEMCNNIFRLSLCDNDKWVNCILNKCNRVTSQSNMKILRENGYDIQDVIKDFVKHVYEKE